jgi:hypothetical protein
MKHFPRLSSHNVIALKFGVDVLRNQLNSIGRLCDYAIDSEGVLHPQHPENNCGVVVANELLQAADAYWLGLKKLLQEYAEASREFYPNEGPTLEVAMDGTVTLISDLIDTLDENLNAWDELPQIALRSKIPPISERLDFPTWEWTADVKTAELDWIEELFQEASVFSHPQAVLTATRFLMNRVDSFASKDGNWSNAYQKLDGAENKDFDPYLARALDLGTRIRDFRLEVMDATPSCPGQID